MSNLDHLVGEECENCGRIHPSKEEGELDHTRRKYCVAPWGHDPDCYRIAVPRLKALLVSRDALIEALKGQLGVANRRLALPAGHCFACRRDMNLKIQFGGCVCRL